MVKLNVFIMVKENSCVSELKIGHQICGNVRVFLKIITYSIIQVIDKTMCIIKTMHAEVLHRFKNLSAHYFSCLHELIPPSNVFSHTYKGKSVGSKLQLLAVT